MWEFNLHPQLIQTLTLLHSKPTPVQNSVLPLMLSHKDVVVEAVTGSGKTLAFVVPMLDILLRNTRSKHQVGAVIVVPTRELATQIFKVVNEVLEVFYSLMEEEESKITSKLVIGGTDLREDIKTFQTDGASILIGTPGRLQDLLTRKLIDTRNVDVLILDEADRLLDLGFERQIQAILIKLPKQRRTGLFSATMNEALNQLVRTGLRNPVKVVVKVQMEGKEKVEMMIPDSLEVKYVLTDQNSKLAIVLNLITPALIASKSKIIIYFSTGACVDFYFKLIGELTDLKIYSLHGKMVPKRRMTTFTSFSQSEGGVLLCTDVAARGLDLPDIDLVIQFDAPQDPKAFAHRCGRSGRMGRKGTGVVLLNENEDTYVEFLRIRKVPVEELEMVGLKDHFDSIRKLLVKDRELYEKSILAFVSWIRSYKEHQASFIFQLQQLDLVSVLKSFGLLKIPGMPELKKKDLSRFVEWPGDTDTIKYKDKIREKGRIRRMLEPKVVVKPKKKQESWSGQKMIKEKRLMRQEKRGRKKVAISMNKELKA